MNKAESQYCQNQLAVFSLRFLLAWSEGISFFSDQTGLELKAVLEGILDHQRWARDVMKDAPEGI